MSKKKIFVDSPSRTGDFSEYYAVTWLWDSGYEVFVNAGCTGPIDLIAYKDGDLVLIDVKTLSKDKRWGYYRVGTTRTDHQKEIGVKILGFNPETRQLRFVKHND